MQRWYITTQNNIKGYISKTKQNWQGLMRWLSGQKALAIQSGRRELGLQKLSSDLFMSTWHAHTRTPLHPISYTYMIIITKMLDHHYGNFTGLCVGLAKANLVGSDLWCREVFSAFCVILIGL